MGPSADGPAPSKLSGSGAGDARFERLGRRCGVTCAEPSDSGCVASSSLIATSRAPPSPRAGWSGCTPAMGDEYFLRRVRRACHTTAGFTGDRGSSRRYNLCSWRKYISSLYLLMHKRPFYGKCKGRGAWHGATPGGRPSHGRCWEGHPWWPSTPACCLAFL